MNKLLIQELKVNAIIGVFDWEQQIRQTLLIDLEIEHDFSALNDQIENALDYDALCKYVTELIESRSFQLIETVAVTIADSLKDRYDRILRLIVKVGKPHAVRSAQNIIAIVERA